MAPMLLVTVTKLARAKSSFEASALRSGLGMCPKLGMAEEGGERRHKGMVERLCNLCY